jgi:hypothetical protein
MLLTSILGPESNNGSKTTQLFGAISIASQQQKQLKQLK